MSYGNTAKDGTGTFYHLLVDSDGFLLSKSGHPSEVTVLSSAARTSTTQSSDFTNVGARGVILTLDVTSITATPSITLNIEYKDPVSSNYETIFSAAAAVTATGTHTYLFYPSSGSASDDITEVQNMPLPRTWRVNVTHADGDSITYSVGGSYLL